MFDPGIPSTSKDILTEEEYDSVLREDISRLLKLETELEQKKLRLINCLQVQQSEEAGITLAPEAVVQQKEEEEQQSLMKLFKACGISVLEIEGDTMTFELNIGHKGVYNHRHFMKILRNTAAGEYRVEKYLLPNAVNMPSLLKKTQLKNFDQVAALVRLVHLFCCAFYDREHQVEELRELSEKQCLGLDVFKSHNVRVVTIRFHPTDPDNTPGRTGTKKEVLIQLSYQPENVRPSDIVLENCPGYSEESMCDLRQQFEVLRNYSLKNAIMIALIKEERGDNFSIPPELEAEVGMDITENEDIESSRITFVQQNKPVSARGRRGRSESDSSSNSSSSILESELALTYRSQPKAARRGRRAGRGRAKVTLAEGFPSDRPSSHSSVSSEAVRRGAIAQTGHGSGRGGHGRDSSPSPSSSSSSSSSSSVAGFKGAVEEPKKKKELIQSTLSMVTAGKLVRGVGSEAKQMTRRSRGRNVARRGTPLKVTSVKKV